ncbi:plasmid pRiA4b ORF-3 family protein [Kitasatospora sp. NBC_01302]|uniref:plasmid pRiA4b ORF-3 family protein n=1 Tax=Kitasatospora sp. NBC_01302 TaxID=2903575 RepID=UPI002E13542A|nr:plasmid pRiA4b ORF-3 family protein [Kitasatospora sp. NBC_01302]
MEPERPRTVEQVRGLVSWIGAGRKLTQTGKVTLADARALVTLLETGDTVDPAIGERTFKTKSSQELYHLNLLVEWAKAARLLRVTGGRLVPVKKNARVLEDPERTLDALFEALPRIGEAVLPSGWLGSMLAEEYPAGLRAVLTSLYATDLPAPEQKLRTAVWETLSGFFVLDDLPEDRLRLLRQSNDRDVDRLLATFKGLGATQQTGKSVTLTSDGRKALARLRGEPRPGDPVYELRVQLADANQPAVWRRVQVPAGIRLDNLHRVIQATMGWQNCHLYAFSANGVDYGRRSAELDLVDETTAALDTVAKEGTQLDYTYDFGDSWDHRITVEHTMAAEASHHYPACVDGAGACPPEDCGGPGGYEDLKQTLRDPAHPEHEDLLRWIGLDSAADFDPAHFDLRETNRQLRTLGW